MARVALAKTEFDSIVLAKEERAKGAGKAGSYCFITLATLGCSLQCMTSKEVYDMCPAQGEKVRVVANVCPIKANVKRGDKFYESDVTELDIVAITSRNPGVKPLG